MRKVKLVDIIVTEVLAHSSDSIRCQLRHPIPLSPSSDRPMEVIDAPVEVRDKRIMDMYRVTGYGERQENFVVWSDELEYLLQIPSDLMHDQKVEIDHLNSRIANAKQAGFFKRLSFLFKPSALGDML